MKTGNFTFKLSRRGIVLSLLATVAFAVAGTFIYKKVSPPEAGPAGVEERAADGTQKGEPNYPVYKGTPGEQRKLTTGEKDLQAAAQL